MKLGHIILTPNELLMWHGAMTIEIGLHGNVEASLLEVIKLIDINVLEQRMRAPIIVIDGRVPDEQDPNEILELVQVLKRKNYTVFGKISGAVWPRWAEHCSKIAAMVTNEPWLGFSCDELQYIPPVGGPLVEPNIGAAGSALKNLYIGNKLPPAEVFAFLSQAQVPWQITTAAKFNYVLTVVKE